MVKKLRLYSSCNRPVRYDIHFLDLLVLFFCFVSCFVYFCLFFCVVRLFCLFYVLFWFVLVFSPFTVVLFCYLFEIDSRWIMNDRVRKQISSILYYTWICFEKYELHTIKPVFFFSLRPVHTSLPQLASATQSSLVCTNDF